MAPKSNMAAAHHFGLRDRSKFFADSETWGPSLASCKKEKNRHRNEQSLGCFKFIYFFRNGYIVRPPPSWIFSFDQKYCHK